MKGKRIVAYIIDFFIVSLITSLLLFLPVFKNVRSAQEEFTNYTLEALKGGSSDLDEEALQNKSYDTAKETVTLEIITIGITVIYFCVFGYIRKGQTIGKQIMKIKIVNIEDENNLNPGLYILREVIKTNAIFDFINICLLIFASKSTYLSISSIVTNISQIFLIVIIGVLIFRDDERGLHDIICKTKVISTVDNNELIVPPTK